MKQEILFVLLDNFADWEGAYIAPNLNWGVEPGSESKYVVKTVSVTKGFVVSCGFCFYAGEGEGRCCCQTGFYTAGR